MKAWISICTIILVAGMATALAQETKTDKPASATTNTPSTNEAAVPPPVAAPATTKEVKPPVVTPPKPTKTVVPVPMTATSAPAPVVVKEEKPPVVAPLEETNPVPAQPEITAEPQTPTNNAAAPPADSSGTSHKRVWAGGLAVLGVVGGLAIFLWWRSHAASQGSLITSALAEDQKTREDKNAPPPMT